MALCQPITLSFMEVGATIVTIEAFAAGINPAAIPSKAEQRITPIKDISIHNIVNPQTKEIAKLIITAPFLVDFFIKKGPEKAVIIVTTVGNVPIRIDILSCPG